MIGNKNDIKKKKTAFSDFFPPVINLTDRHLRIRELYARVNSPSHSTVNGRERFCV